jgi:hypothetical protein
MSSGFFGFLHCASRWAVGIALGFWALPAWASNQDSFFFGDQAAITGGSVVAITHDAGGLFYNPAGLAQNDRLRLEVLGNAYLQRSRSVDNVVRVRSSTGTESQSMAGSMLTGVPTAVVFVRGIRRGLSAGVGIYTTEQDYLKLDANSPNDGVGINHARFEHRLTRYHVGPGFGLALSDRLRVGASLLASYETLDHRVDLSAFTKAPQPALQTQFSEVTASRIGGELTVGIQYHPIDALTLGALLRSPRLLFLESRQTLAQASQGRLSDPSLTVGQVSTDRSESFLLAAPMRVTAGVALEGKLGWLNVEGDFSPGLSSQGLTERRVPVWNVRVGGLLRISDRWRAGAGLFTDRAYQPTPDAFPGARVHYYGVTVGVQTRHMVLLAKDQGPESDRKEEETRRNMGHADAPPALYFGTTLAFRYALGIGEMAALDIDTTRTTGSFFGSSGRVSVAWHELAVHLGTGVYF